MKRLGAGVGVWMSLLAVSASAAWPDLPVSPLLLSAKGDPNIIVTLDDSGSMSWDAVPDARTGAQVVRRFAARWNSLAYDPFTFYELPYSPSLDGTKLTTSFTAAPLYGFDPSVGVENLSTNYQSHWAYTAGNLGCYGSCTPYGNGFAAMDNRILFPVGPAFFYSFYNDLGVGNTLPNPGTDPVTGLSLTAPLSTPAFVRNTVAPADCGGLADTENSACYVRVVVPTAHQANFAAWFSFYRNRHLATVSGANLAFFDMPTNYRVTWQSINRCRGFNNASCLGWDNVNRTNVIRPFTNSAHRSLFYQWLHRVPHHYGTPLVEAAQSAGEFYSQTGVETPMANQPGISMTGPGTAATNTCRPNYHVMMTDGLWNGSSSSLGNVDDTPGPLGDGTSYVPAAPYRDATSGTLADVAFHYWKTDLQPGLANELAPYTDPSRPAGSSRPWNDPATWQHMISFNVGLGLGRFLDGNNGRLLWGGNSYAGSFAALDAGTVNWPSATSGSTNTVADLWHASINSRGEFFSADNPTSIRVAFKKILSRVSAGQASGGQIGSSGRRIGTGTRTFFVGMDSDYWTGKLSAYDVNADGSLGALAWHSDSTFTNSVGRNIFTWDAAGASGRTFTWGAFTPAEQLSYFGNDSGLFDYLRGVRTGETSLYRRRDQLLGDVIASDLVVSGKFDSGYSVLPGAAGSSYRAFVASKKTLVMFGANDGMLHAFRNNGSEAFAYVPSAMLPSIRTLSQVPFLHESRVDGPLTLADAYINGGWKSLLLGGLGAGGKSYFALDVTGESVTSGSPFSASSVLFELNHSEMGYTFARPAIARQTNGDWVAFFANGYGGASKRAVLFVKNLTTGVLTTINTNSGSAASPNGLSAPTVMARQVGKAEAVYAGDYRGNMWKFVQDTSGTWVVAHSGTPLFVAQRNGAVQPIVAAPTLESHPAGGVMVLFGTGKHFEANDRTDGSVQSFYGIRDRGAPISGGRASLLAQSITAGATTTAQYRSVSENKISSTAGGWYLDFTTTNASAASGEKVVASALVLDDTVVFNTFAPSNNACSGLGTSFEMSVNLFSGGLPAPQFDENGDGRLDAGDKIAPDGRAVAGKRIQNGGTLMAPIAAIVGLQTRGSPSSGSSTCGGASQAPCLPPQDACSDGLIVKNGVCSAISCPSGSIMVNNTRCYLTAKRATWTALR